MKKIFFSLLILPLLFSLGSFFISQKAHAQITTCSNGIFINNPSSIEKLGAQTKYTVKISNSSPTACTYTPFVSAGPNVTNWNFSFSLATIQIPAGSFKNIIITAKPPSSWLNNPSNNEFRFRLKLNGTQILTFRDIDYPASYSPFCDENTTTNCQKCSSNSQCSSKANFKYCAPTTDRCSDLETYKTSVCRANNYCGTVSLGSAGQVSCGGCGNGNSCNTNTNKCVTTPNCTTGVKLGKCEPKSGRPQGNGSACSSIAGSQTRTFTDRPGFSTCKQTATTPQNCTPNATDVCSSGICSIGKCVQCTTSNLKNCTSGQFCNSDNKCETRNQKTLSFTGYVFIDEDGNGRRGDNELFYKEPYTVQADSTVNSTLTGYAYDLRRTTSASQVNVRLIVPSGYVATKLNYQDFVGGTAITASVDGSSKTFSANNTVNFGIKKAQANTPTKDLIVSAFTFPGGVDTGTSDPIVKIKNIGNTAISGDFKVTVTNRAGGASKAWTVTQVVSPNEVIDLSSRFVNMPRPVAGTYTAKAIVDSNISPLNPNGEIIESNEGNNSKTDSYTTTKPGSGGSGGGNGGGTTTTPQPTCDRNAPTLEVTPANRNGAPGTEKAYDIKVINNDKGANCDPVTFVLSKEHLPNTNWTGRFDDNTLENIGKNGGSKSTQYHVKSPAGATDGSKTITVGVRRQGQTAALKTVNATYTVQDNTVTKAPTEKPITDTPPTTEPVTDGPTPPVCQKSNPSISVSPQTKEGVAGDKITYSITVENNDAGPCDDRNLSISAIPLNQDWTVSILNQETAQFKAGEKRIINVEITSPKTINTGEYNTIVWLSENNQQIQSIVAIYTVTGDQISPVPGKTYLNFKLGLDGIGTTPRIPIGGNKNPLNANRGLNVNIYNTTTNTLSYSLGNITATYNTDSQKFERLWEIDPGANLPDGTYNIYVDGPRYLMNQYPGSVTITKGQVTNLTSDNFYLITGNINNNDLSANKLDLMDYNLLISCSIYSQDTSACDQDTNYKTYADLDDDGIVNEDDYTLFLKELINQQGVSLPN